MFLSRLNYVQHLRLSLKNVCDSVTREILHKILTKTFLVLTSCSFDMVTNVSCETAASSSGTLNSVYPHN